MILETVSCLVLAVLYGGFTVFKKENRQDLLQQISDELKQEQAHLLLEKIKAEQALLPPPILNDKPKIERPPIFDGSSSRQNLYNPPKVSLNKGQESEDVLAIIFDYLKSNTDKELLYSQQRFVIKYHPTIKSVSLYEVNSRTGEISQSSSLTVREIFSEISYRKSFSREFELRMYGILSHKESLLKDFKKHFIIVPSYPKNMERRNSTRNVPITEYHSFILKVKRHYTENSLTRRYHTINSAATFLQYCQIVGISYSHLNNATLVEELRRLETSNISLEDYTTSRYLREMLDRY